MELGDPEGDARKTPQHRMYMSGNAGSRTTACTLWRCIFGSTPAGDSLCHPRERRTTYIAVPPPDQIRECASYRRIRAASECKRRLNHNNPPRIEDTQYAYAVQTLLPCISYENSIRPRTPRASMVVRRVRSRLAQFPKLVARKKQ